MNNKIVQIDIGSLEKRYRISKCGEIYNIAKNKALSGTITTEGYNSIYLVDNVGGRTYYRHRVVATKFIPKIMGKNFINHKNGNKLDNRVENLEWCTNSENLRHSIKMGNKHGPPLRYNEISMEMIYLLVSRYTHKEVSKLLGIRCDSVGKILRNDKKRLTIKRGA